VGIRDKLKRVEQAARSNLDCIELQSGERYWYEPVEAAKTLFLFGCDCGRADYVGERPRHRR
jgi:hypothetical protein